MRPLCFALVLSACGSDPAPSPGADAAPDVAQDAPTDRAEASADATARCSSPGTASNCMCGAAQGRHVCLPGGGYTPCECPDAGGPDVALEDAAAPDAGLPPLDAGPPPDADPCGSPALRECDVNGVSMCVNITGGRRQPDGTTLHCGRCGNTCAAGFGCLGGTCERL